MKYKIVNSFNQDNNDWDYIDYILIVVLISIIVYLIKGYFYPNTQSNKEHMAVFGTYESNYAPLYVSGIDADENIPRDLNRFAKKVAYDLQNPFPSSTTGVNRAPWNPNEYAQYMEPNGQVVGFISPN